MDSVGHVSLMFSILSESKGFSDYQGKGPNGDLQLRFHYSGSVILILLPAVGTPFLLLGCVASVLGLVALFYCVLLCPVRCCLVEVCFFSEKKNRRGVDWKRGVLVGSWED